MKKIDRVERINKKLFLNGHVFHIHRNAMLRCSYYLKTKCPVRVKKIITQNEVMYMPTTTDIHNHETDKKEYIKSNTYEDLNKITEGISRTESLDIIVNNVLKQYKLNSNVKVFADKESISFIKESQIIFAECIVLSRLCYLNKGTLFFFSEKIKNDVVTKKYILSISILSLCFQPF